MKNNKYKDVCWDFIMQLESFRKILAINYFYEIDLEDKNDNWGRINNIRSLSELLQKELKELLCQMHEN
jgi:hypothetical protein